jgi:cytochrome P450
VNQINLLDLEPFGSSREHEIFRSLRDRPGLTFNPEPDGHGFWSLVRYDDIVEGARAGSILISGKGTQIKDRRAEGHGAPSVHNSDAAFHGKLRAIVMPGLSRSAMERRKIDFERIAEQLVLSCPTDEPFDYVERIAVRLPMLVLADVLGVPTQDAPALVNWANTMSDVSADNAEQNNARNHLFEYFRNLADRKRKQPGDDLATLLVQAEFPEGQQAQQLLDVYFMLLTIAGNETTRFLLTGGLAQVIRQDAYASLCKAPHLIPVSVEEMCRFVSPVTHMRRTAAADTLIAGQVIKAGDKVVLWFASGNRDERQFVDPDILILDRKPNHHIGFGVGAHFCLGAHLARLEAKLLFEALTKHISSISLVAEPVRVASNWFTAWSAMQVKWR